MIIESSEGREFIEIKSSETFKVKMIEQLSLFRAEEIQNNNKIKSALLYQGINRPDYDNIQIKNYSDYLLN